MISARLSTRMPNVVAKYDKCESSRPSLCISTTVVADPCLLFRPMPSNPSFPAASASFLSKDGP
jgi:hypothetical protein